MELTISNLIFFLEEKLTYNESLFPFSILRDWEDGVGAVYFIEDLSKEFNVTFENFDFHQYFLDEAELSIMTWKHLFGLRMQREIHEELTIQMLYDYMIKNKKQ